LEHVSYINIFNSFYFYRCFWCYWDWFIRNGDKNSQKNLLADNAYCWSDAKRKRNTCWNGNQIRQALKIGWASWRCTDSK